MPLPVSVIVPHLPSRKLFLNRFCLPALRANAPAEIIVEPDFEPYGNGNRLRNAGAAKATQEMLAFVDDDVVVAGDFLSRLTAALDANPAAGYAYCDSEVVVFSQAPIALGRGRSQRPGPFDAKRLCKANYISTMSLIRRTVFPGFDAAIRRLQDWDLWLTLLGKGVVGTYVPENLFLNCSIDAGVTARESKEFWRERIVAKHAATMRRHA